MPYSPGPTPAPWHWEVDTEENHAQQALGHSSKDVAWKDVLLAVTVNDADRALLAAAPELVAALRKVTAELRLWVESELGGTTGYEAEMVPVLEAEALLRRIEGEP